MADCLFSTQNVQNGKRLLTKEFKQAEKQQGKFKEQTISDNDGSKKREKKIGVKKKSYIGWLKFYTFYIAGLFDAPVHRYNDTNAVDLAILGFKKTPFIWI